MSEAINNITIVGAGLMGQGIALEFAIAGFHVRLNDITEEKLQQSVEDINRSLNMIRSAGLQIDDKAISNINDIKTDINLKNITQDSDLVIESVYEDLPLKQLIFHQLDEICPEHTILASNTSTFMPSSLSFKTKRPERLLVMHYFNPPYLLPLVEIVKGEMTDQKTVDTISDLLTKIGKKPLILKKELLGFVANRLQAALVREAFSLVEKGIATPEEIDTVMVNSIGRRYQTSGIFELADLAGLDVGFALISQLFPDLESSPDIPTLFTDKVEKGEMGAKTGRGFYAWSRERIEAVKRKIVHSLITQCNNMNR